MLKKSTIIYFTVLLALALISLGCWTYWNHLINAAYHTAGVSDIASKHNHGVASAYANVIATYADNWRFWFTLSISLAGAWLMPGIVEFLILPLLGLSRLGAIARVTYYEALLQPFTLIVFLLCLAAIIITAFVPFNTFGDDTEMFRDVALSFVLMFSLVIMVFATGKVVDEEIENRTMLTLMSKPVARWQVVVGKYLGILCLLFVVMAITTICTAGCDYLRFFSDKRIDLDVSDMAERQALFWSNFSSVIVLLPAFIMQFMEIATLAAISTGISTRYSLALNMTAIVLLYIGANLTRFIPLLNLAHPWQEVVQSISYLLPFLSNFDINQCLVYRPISMPGHFIKNAPTIGQVWEYVVISCTYGLLYIGAALAAAIALFRNRELT